MKKITRDLMVSVTATLLLIFEVVIGGGRPTVLTALTGILLSPVIMRVDEARRNGKAANGKSEPAPPVDEPMADEPKADEPKADEAKSDG